VQGADGIGQLLVALNLQSELCNLQSQSVISPRLTARRTASVRFFAPSFPEIDET